MLVRQGDPDNDILFIIHGEVVIFANERPVATRTGMSYRRNGDC
jgi:CRP-like cAMP-binding protein